MEKKLNPYKLVSLMNMVFNAKDFTSHINMPKEMQQLRSLGKEGRIAGMSHTTELLKIKFKTNRKIKPPNP